MLNVSFKSQLTLKLNLELIVMLQFLRYVSGIGKGLVGVVTRPTSGVIDFASSSFEGIKR